MFHTSLLNELHGLKIKKSKRFFQLINDRERYGLYARLESVSAVAKPKGNSDNVIGEEWISSLAS